MKKYKLEVYKTDYYAVVVQAHNFEEATEKVSLLEDVIDMYNVDTDGYDLSDEVKWVYNEETEDWEEVG